MPTLNLEEIGGLLPEAAEAAAAALPGPPLAAGFAGEGTTPDEFIPAGGRGVVCRIRGLRGRLVLLLAPEVVYAVENGPFGNQGLATAIEGAFRSAATVLDRVAPAAVRIEAAQEVDAAASIESAATCFHFMAIPLFEGEDHRASLALLLDDPNVPEDVPEPTVAAPAQAAAPAPAAAPARQEAPIPEPVMAMSGAPAYAAASAPAPAMPQATYPIAEFPMVAQGRVAAPAGVHPLRLLHDVEMAITAELGRTRMSVRGILGLTPGSVVELDRAAGSPVDLLVNGTLIARGEVVVIDEEFGVRISEIVGRSDEDQ